MKPAGSAILRRMGLGAALAPEPGEGRAGDARARYTSLEHPNGSGSAGRAIADFTASSAIRAR